MVLDSFAEYLFLFVGSSVIIVSLTIFYEIEYHDAFISGRDINSAGNNIVSGIRHIAVPSV